jgi:NAD(P)H-hydrate epimerase
MPLPERRRDAHKGTAGEVVIVGGSAGMIGAPCFSALGALRVGCGVVRLAVPEAIRMACLTLVPSAMAIATDARGAWLRRLDRAAVVAFGPGMEPSTANRQLLAAILRRGHRVVVDGGGLSSLAQHPAALAGADRVALTPHPGEWRRLATAYRVSGDPLAQRPAAARALARAARACVVLKGPRTVIDDGRRRTLNRTGSPALAIPGSGDVLTGVIAALIAHGLPPYEAARLGARLHGIAGGRWAARGTVEGLLAPELAALLPEAIARDRAGQRRR